MSGLPPFTTYRVQVAAVNSAGIGLYTGGIFFRTEGIVQTQKVDEEIKQHQTVYPLVLCIYTL